MSMCERVQGKTNVHVCVDACVCENEYASVCMAYTSPFRMCHGIVLLLHLKLKSPRRGCQNNITVQLQLLFLQELEM